MEAQATAEVCLRSSLPSGAAAIDRANVARWHAPLRTSASGRAAVLISRPQTRRLHMKAAARLQLEPPQVQDLSDATLVTVSVTEASGISANSKCVCARCKAASACLIVSDFGCT